MFVGYTKACLGKAHTLANQLVTNYVDEEGTQQFRRDAITFDVLKTISDQVEEHTYINVDTYLQEGVIRLRIDVEVAEGALPVEVLLILGRALVRAETFINKIDFTRS